MMKIEEMVKQLKSLDEWFKEYEKWYAQWKAKNEVAAFDDSGSNPGPPPPPPPPRT